MDSNPHTGTPDKAPYTSDSAVPSWSDLLLKVCEATRGKRAYIAVCSATAVSLVLVLVGFFSTSSAPPDVLKPADNWAECVPGGGPVTVTTAGGAVPAVFSCPPDGWLALPSPGRADEAIRTVEQSDPDLTLTPEELTYGSQVKRVYRPQRSITELAFVPRDVVLRFECGNGADIVEISREGAATRALHCSTRERHFNILTPEDARVDLVFRNPGGGSPQSCQAVLAHVDTIDLIYPDVCTASIPDSIARPPLRPFVAGLDTRTDPHTGLVWMRDLFRYGNAAQIEPDNADNSLAVILAAVVRDTGQDGWRIASDVEVQSAARSIFLPQGPVETERLRGIVADPDCSNGGFAKLDISARQDAPLAGTGFELARPCNLNAPEFGLWLVREP
ncbi:MAG: hypothetical protein ABJH75_10280 [Roseibium sp.]|uniref:hypothetical protein n=1 Tax=Roseibium sp. TaxID=1936156 RepID=UPI0032633B78